MWDKILHHTEFFFIVFIALTYLQQYSKQQTCERLVNKNDNSPEAEVRELRNT